MQLVYPPLDHRQRRPRRRGASVAAVTSVAAPAPDVPDVQSRAVNRLEQNWRPPANRLEVGTGAGAELPTLATDPSTSWTSLF